MTTLSAIHDSVAGSSDIIDIDPRPALTEQSPPSEGDDVTGVTAQAWRQPVRTEPFSHPELVLYIGHAVIDRDRVGGESAAAYKARSQQSCRVSSSEILSHRHQGVLLR